MTDRRTSSKKPPPPPRMTGNERTDRARTDRRAIRGEEDDDERIGGIPLSELEEGLRIDPDALEDACVNQAVLFYKVGKELAFAISSRDAAHQALRETEATVDQSIRDDWNESDGKLTEKDVESQKRMHKTVIAAVADEQKWQKRVGQLQALKEAYQARGYALKDMVTLYVTDYYASQPVEGRDARQRRGEEAREAMAQARREKPGRSEERSEDRREERSSRRDR